jgi:hypothetical protein
LPKASGTTSSGVSDEDGAIADPREARDVLDHLGVVVGRQVRLVLAAVVHRQPADEVGQPDVGGRLQLRVLVQEVVDLPGLVADPEVVLLVADHVEEEHEVRDQDLVHPPDRLERVQVVLGRLALDVPGLVRELGARGMDPLALGFEHGGHRVLREPVDLEVRVERAELLRDRHVAPGVPEPDRRRDVERPALPVQRPRPGLHLRRGRHHPVGEVLEEAVHLDGVARLRKMPGAVEGDERPAGQLGHGLGAGAGLADVEVAVEHEHGAAHSPADVARLLLARPRLRRLPAREDDGLGAALERPFDGVLELLRRVRLRQPVGEEPFEEAAVVLPHVLQRVVGAARVRRRQHRQVWRDRGDAEHGRRIGRREHERIPGPVAEAADERLLRSRGGEHGAPVAHELPPVVRRRRRRPVGAAVPARIEDDGAEVAREVRNLPLPEARVRDRRGRIEEKRRRPVAVGLPEDADAVALDEALLVGVAGARLLALVREHAHATLRTKSRSSRLK